MVMQKNTTLVIFKKCVIIINMDEEARNRRQNLRVIISEIIMFLTIVIMAIILALLASGYWLSSGFKVERQGMLQIHSQPTGADVEIDGETAWLQRTNTSKVLSSGNHHVVLTKEGYDSWEKTITISEGLLYRVNYPRLFLLNREKDIYYDATNFTTASFSHNSNYLLLGDDTTSYTILRLNSDRPETTKLNLLDLKSTSPTIESSAMLFADSTPIIEWDINNNLIATIDKKHYKINWQNSEISLLSEPEKPEETLDLPGEIFRFYDETYSVLLNDNILNLYKKSQNDIELILTDELQFTPETLKIGGSGGFVFMQTDTNVAVLDMEILQVINWTLDSPDYGWLGSSMLYSINDGTLIVYDFDGQNRRELSKDVTPNFPVAITDNKWLYYFSDNNIVREVILK